MKEVVAYCRVACARESDPSVEARRQAHIVRRYADTRGLSICETYLDAGVSGGTLERPALQRLLPIVALERLGTVITQDPEGTAQSVVYRMSPQRVVSFSLKGSSGSKAEMSFRNWVACTTAESGITFGTWRQWIFRWKRRLRRRLHL